MHFYLYTAITIIIFAFLCEYMDSTLGMGYGTTMAPLLLLMGFAPAQIVPAILLSELVTGVLAGVMHSREGNVNFKLKSYSLKVMRSSVKSLGWQESFRKGFPKHLRVVMLLVVCSLMGAVSAVFTAQIISKFWQQIYIGAVVTLMGIIILICFNRDFKFSWFKISFLGVAASFNKGLTGGGYGPLIVSGQLLSGVNTKNAVGITSLAEGLTCIVGVLMYIVISKEAINWQLAPLIILGAVCSVPLSVKSVKHINSRTLKIIVAGLTIILGIFTLVKTLKEAKLI